MITQVRKWIFRQRMAYRQLFQPGGNYSAASGIVMADLAQFCKGRETTVVINPTTRTVDPYASAMLEGRRQVWLRITQNLHMSDADIYRIMEHERQQLEQGDEDGSGDA